MMAARSIQPVADGVGDSLGAAVEIGETSTLILLSCLFHLFKVFPL